MTYDSFDAFTAHQLCRRATVGYDAMKKNYPGRRFGACFHYLFCHDIDQHTFTNRLKLHAAEYGSIYLYVSCC